ncbi:unannotated protein [freshwater metagenome]|uniref:Unannotated protein n=1 Tax=freshwater metagenome TaxID=449393 RepID=A0A6J7G2Z9_9ZZZZ
MVVDHGIAPGRPASWGKVVLLRELLEKYDQVVWVDSDAVIVDPTADIFDGVSRGRHLHLVVHRYLDLEVPNLGVMVMKSSWWSKRFLERIWSCEKYVEHKWWENAAALELLGYDVSAPRRSTRHRTMDGRFVGELDLSWNSIPIQPSAHPRLRHFPGMTQVERLSEMQRAASEMSGSPMAPDQNRSFGCDDQIGVRGLELLERAAARRRFRFRLRHAPRREPSDQRGGQVAQDLAGLSAAHHETRLIAESQAAVIDRMSSRLTELEARLAEATVASEIMATSTWIRACATDSDVLVSVILPTFNRRSFVERAIESVRNQTHRRLEIIVIDDGGSDDTPEFVACVEDDRIRLVRHAHNRGASAARNTGLDHAAGDIVVHLDSDNFFDRDWVQSVVWAFDTYPERHHLYGARVFDDVARAHSPVARGLPGLQLLRWDSEGVLANNLVDMNVLAHRQTSLRFDEGTYSFDDWDFLLKLVDRHGPPLRLPVIAAHYTTDAPDRMMLADPVRHVQNYERIRSRWARPEAR